MTREVLIEVTAGCIRHVRRTISLIAPQQVIRNLRAARCLAMVTQAALTLMSAPTLVTDASAYPGFGTTRAIAWSGYDDCGEDPQRRCRRLVASKSIPASHTMT